ncbi:MAG: polysaccharide pyruvyl transferase family protein [Rhodospirillaceae bacterium]|nr:polysaccharide pyruvyl transferase family protein [Rhodospirillaceae bacterium]
MIYTSASTPRPPVPLHVVLYALIPEDRAYRPIPRRPLLFVRNRLRRWAELLSWRFLGRWRAHYSTFKDRDDTNRGDIAIRMGVKRQIERAFANHEITITDLPWGSLAMALKMTPAPDLLVIAGGGFFFADRDGRLPQRFKDDVKVLEKLSCPVAVCAVGLNWLIEGSDQKIFRFHPESRADVRQFLSRATLASVRDATTQRALGSAGRRPLPVIVDPGFLVAEPPTMLRTPDPSRPLEVGINMAFHGAHTSHTSQWMLPLMLRIVKRLRDEAGCRFTYFVHSDGEAGLARALKLAGVPLDVVHADVDDMVAAYRRMDIHIGQMLHSAILAMSVGTPALSLAYDVKSAGFYNLLGLDELCLDAAAASEEEIVSCAKALIEGRHAVAARLRARRAELEAESRDFYAQVAALVAPCRSGRIPALHAADGARSRSRGASH